MIEPVHIIPISWIALVVNIHSTYPNPKMIGITIPDPLEGIHETMWLLYPVLNNRLVGKQSKDSH